MAGSELKVSVGESRIVSSSEGFHWFAHTLFKLRDGSLLLGFSICEDAGQPKNLAEGGSHVLLKSWDGGVNWFFLARVCAWDLWPFCELDDGTILADSATYLKPSGEAFTLGWRSRDGGRTFEGPTEVPMNFPQGLLREPDLQSPGKVGAGMHIGESMPIQLDNGDLLTAAYAQFRGDKNSRSIALSTPDKCASWNYVSTIAYDPDVYGEGFDEPYMLRVPDRRILCMLRTGSGRPIYQSWSSDDGKSWSEPVKTGVIGVEPKLLLITSGVIACSYGRSRKDVSDRPGPVGFPSEDAWIMFSRDGGETWTNHTKLYEGPSTGYTSMVELSPGELLCTHDALGFGWERANSIMMVKVRVQAGG